MRALSHLAMLSVLVACSGKPAETNARLMNGTGVAYGNCVEARKRAAAKPDLDVDRLPTPRPRQPAVFRNIPDSVTREMYAKGMVARVNVVVDTLGRADMKTFQVLEVSNRWFADNLKTVLPTWRFTPAMLAGCKVRRVYKFSVTGKPRS